MLQAFRSRGLSSVIYGVLIVGMVLVFVLGFNPSAGKKTAALGEACAARVKGHCITPKDHMAAYRMLIPRNEQGELLVAKAKQMGMLRVSLDGLIERELLVSDASRLGITVTDDEVTDDIYDGIIHLSLPSDKMNLAPYLGISGGRVHVNFRDPKTKHFEVKYYERMIKGLMGRSPTEFREEQVREILAAKVRELVRTPVRVSESGAMAAYIDERSTATLTTITVRPSYLGKYLPTPSAKDADAWAADPLNKKAVDEAAEEHKKPHLRHILIKVGAAATAAEKDAAKARLLAAVARVKHGESFAIVAKELSEDTGSAANGGDVGPDTDGFVAPFKEAADKLKPGEMTDAPVETQFGYHAILRDPVMTDEQMHHMMALELFAKFKADKAAKAMAEKIQAGLKAGTDAQKVLDEAIATLVPTVPAATASDAKASKKPGAPEAAPASDRPDTDASRPAITTLAPFSRGGDPIPGLSPESAAKVIQFAFSAKDSDGMDDVLTANGDYVLVSLKTRKNATKEDFAKDKDAFIAALEHQKQDEAFALYMSRLKKVAKNEIKVDDAYLSAKMGTAKTDGGAPGPGEDEDEGP